MATHNLPTRRNVVLIICTVILIIALIGVVIYRQAIILNEVDENGKMIEAIIEEENISEEVIGEVENG